MDWGEDSTHGLGLSQFELPAGNKKNTWVFLSAFADMGRRERQRGEAYESLANIKKKYGHFITLSVFRPFTFSSDY